MATLMVILEVLCGTAGGAICAAMTPAQRGPDAVALVAGMAWLIFSAAPWLVRLLILHVMAPIRPAEIEAPRGERGRR
jgi:hypothetical protein